MSTEPTKADLKAAVTKLTEENAALYDIFAAAREAADAGTDYPWIIGYIGYIGNVGQPCDRGNIQILRALAAGVRRGPGRSAFAPDEITPGPNPPHHVLRTGERACTAVGWNDKADSGYVCTAQNGHDGPDHVAYKLGGGEYRRWPVPVITDSGRTCPCCTDDPLHSDDCNCREDCGVTQCQAADPGPEDADGETWRTDGEPHPIDDDEPEWCERSWHDGDCCPGSREQYAARPASVKL